MPQYLILAKDGTDEEAQQRRLNARPFHLENVKKLKENGQFVIGGATLNAEGKMVGSMMVVAFEDEMTLHEWLDDDPYVTQAVWKEIEIKPFKVANV